MNEVNLQFFNSSRVDELQRVIFQFYKRFFNFSILNKFFILENP